MNTNKYSLTDIPRDKSKGESDKFGIGQYENGLIRFIEHANTPTTIALQGEWGSGKTSLMNTLKNNLCEGDDAKFLGVWINTWEYSLMKDATTSLLEIANGLARSITQIAGNNTSKVGDKIIKFGLMAFSAAFNRGSDFVEEILTDGNKSSIGEIRAELETIINDCIEKQRKQGIVFFIDDLDRIDPPIAVQLLELLKNLFTFNYCIFILAIDYDVVIKGLEPKFGKLTEQNEREFRSFFDKIIQVPFSMPVTLYQIDEFLKESLLSIHYLNDGQSNNKELISAFSEISNLSVGTNPRALKRVLNSLLLIQCINNTKDEEQPDDEDEEQSDSELNLLVNFALVSIQITFPNIYRLLSVNPGFDKWDEEILTQMNLPPLTEQNTQNEKWEKVLFRLCENDYYLRKRFSNISKILNLLKALIEEQSRDVEEVIGDIISLSSVTTIAASDNQPSNADLHISTFLKDLRNKLIPLLKKQLPKKRIAPQGKQVRTNAFIKFSKKDGEYWIKLRADSDKNNIILSISAKSVDITKKLTYSTKEEFFLDDKLQEITDVICELYHKMMDIV